MVVVDDPFRQHAALQTISKIKIGLLGTFYVFGQKMQKRVGPKKFLTL